MGLNHQTYEYNIYAIYIYIYIYIYIICNIYICVYIYIIFLYYRIGISLASRHELWIQVVPGQVDVGTGLRALFAHRRWRCQLVPWNIAGGSPQVEVEPFFMKPASGT